LHCVRAENHVRQDLGPNVVDMVGDEALLYVDRCLIEEGSVHAFWALRDRSLRAGGLAGIGDAEIRGMVEAIEANSNAHGIRLFNMNDPASFYPNTRCPSTFSGNRHCR
jgi:hypothetical protein